MSNNMKDKFTIMLPVHRSNLQLANNCIKNLLDNSDLNIILIDDNGVDSDYINDNRIKFIHNNFTEKQPLVKIWNQCIKECPTEYVIIASWRQRPGRYHFQTIEEKLNEGYGMVAFDELHFFSFSKHLTTLIGFFDEGFTRGQYEDTDWWNRLKTNNIGIYVGYVPEERVLNGQHIGSTWLNENYINKAYCESKWTEDRVNNTLIQHKDELNYNDRMLYKGIYLERTYKTWDESVLFEGLKNFFNTYKNYKKNY